MVLIQKLDLFNRVNIQVMVSNEGMLSVTVLFNLQPDGHTSWSIFKTQIHANHM